MAVPSLVVNQLQLFEYHPLLTSRCHNFMNEKKSKILNREFKQTYEKFLRFLVEVAQPSPAHLLAWSYYLLLQERIEEAIRVFQKIDAREAASSSSGGAV